MFIVNGEIYVDHVFRYGIIEIRNGKLRLHPPNKNIPEEAVVLDANGNRIVPGFIDIHTHGAVGIDVNSASADELEKLGSFLAENGTTSWLASVLADTEEQMSWCIGQYRIYKNSRRRGAQLLGLHLEGPFLAEAYKGAMPRELLQKGNAELVHRYQMMAEGGIRYITVSPEAEGVLDLLPVLRKEDIVAAMGHSGADYATAMEAIRRGVMSATHTGNAMRLLHQHEPGILGAALESDIYCEVICDGKHLHPGMVRLIIKVKGTDRVIAITDSIMATGMPDGCYHLGVNQVIVKKGDAKLASDGTRAGSTLTQNIALTNLLSYTGLSLEKVLPMLTENPARLIGVFNQKGSIADGKDADLVFLDKKNTIANVMIGGQIWDKNQFKY